MRGHLATILSSAGFASASLFMKLVLSAGVGVWSYTLLSSLGALLLLAVFLRGEEEQLLPHLQANWPDYLLYALSGSVSTIVFVLALVHLSISLATMLLFTYPAVVTIANWLMFGVRPSKAHLAAVGLTLMGAVLTLNPPDVISGRVSVIGVGYALLTALGHGIYIVLGPRLADELPAVASTALTRLAVCVTVLVLFPVAALSQIPKITPYGWTLTALSTLVTGVPPYFLLTVGVATLGANKAAVVSVVELPIAMAIGMLFEREVVSSMQWVGAALILAALLVSQWRTPAQIR